MLSTQVINYVFLNIHGMIYTDAAWDTIIIDGLVTAQLTRAGAHCSAKAQARDHRSPQCLVAGASRNLQCKNKLEPTGIDNLDGARVLNGTSRAPQQLSSKLKPKFESEAEITNLEGAREYPFYYAVLGK